MVPSTLTYCGYDIARQAEEWATNALNALLGTETEEPTWTNRTCPCFISHTGSFGWSWGRSGVLSLPERAGLGWALRSLQRLQSLERTCTMHVEGRDATTIQHVYTKPWIMQTSLPGSHSFLPARSGGCTHSVG